MRLLKCSFAMAMAILLPAAITASSASAATWQRVGSMAERRHAATATLLNDGTVLVTGGEGQKGRNFPLLASTERFDPKTNSFTAQNPMSVPRFGHTAVRLRDGRVLVLGGVDDQGRWLASTEIFDPATGRFTPAGNMTEPREVATATLLLDGHVLVVGGRVGVGSDAPRRALGTAEIFDPGTGRFQPTGSPGGPRSQHAAVALPDGRVAILGGQDLTRKALRRVEIYDPASGAFALGGELATARISPTTILLPDGKILLAGGAQRGANEIVTLLKEIESYDPATGQSQAVGTLIEARLDPVAALLPNGNTLLAGGWLSTNPRKVLQSAELVQLSTGTVTPAPPMSDPRVESASVLLLDGRVLVVGGESGSRVLETAEVYMP